MSEYKYLSDGRKVVVIGQLNNVESIVQEVFITEGGDQVPSGEKFTTKNLHDEPVLSWKAKEEKKWEQRTEEAKRTYEGINRNIDNIRIKQKGLTAIFKQSRLLADNFEGQDLETLSSVMSGACEYLVISSYGVPNLVRFEDEMMNIDSGYHGKKFESIKLISLMGQTNGRMDYRINRWNDGSGSNTLIYPFNSRDDAIEKIKDIILKDIEEDKIPSFEDYKKILMYGIKLNKKIIAKIKSNALSRKKNYLKTLKENYEKSVKQETEETASINEVFE